MAESTKRREAPGRNHFKYKPGYGVIIICENETAQIATYERLKKQGHKKLKVVTV